MRLSRINVIALIATGMIHLAPGLASAAVPEIPGAGPTPHASLPCESDSDCTDLDEPTCNPDTNLCFACTLDSECGDEDSGRVCNPSGGACLEGCRGTGNGCPDGGTCTSVDETIGKCIPKEDGSNSDSHGNPGSSPDSSDTPSTGGSAGESSSSGDTEDCNSDPTEGGSEDASTGSGDDTGIDPKTSSMDDVSFDCDCDAGTRGAGGPLMLLGLAGLAIRHRRR